MAARRRWIAFAASERGTLHLDAGAVTALREQGASLLAAGVARVEGAFDQRDVVALVGPDGVRIGRGIVYCDTDSARSWCGGAPPSGGRNHHALAHRAFLPKLPVVGEALRDAGVTLKADDRAGAQLIGAEPAGERDWGSEYGDLTLNVRTVDRLEEAVGTSIVLAAPTLTPS